MFFCIPIVFGCPTSIKPENGTQTARVCPRCHNSSVIAAKKKTWFELFWVPLIPLSSKHIWVCSICQWWTPTSDQAPQEAGRSFHPQPNQGFQTHNQSGYNPVYIPHDQKQW